MRDRFLPTPAGWDARRYSYLYKGVAEPVGVVSPVPKQGGGGWDRGQQSPRADIIRGVARGEEHPDRAALRVREDE